MYKIKSVMVVVSMLFAMAFSQVSYAEAVWIDVRTPAENHADNIAGDPLISYSSIVKEVTQLYPDKNTEIHLYCRSGRRADVALSSLKSAGYKNVSNEGSIGNARKVRSTFKL